MSPFLEKILSIPSYSFLSLHPHESRQISSSSSYESSLIPVLYLLLLLLSSLVRPPPLLFYSLCGRTTTAAFIGYPTPLTPALFFNSLPCTPPYLISPSKLYTPFFPFIHPHISPIIWWISPVHHHHIGTHPPSTGMFLE